MDRLLWTDVWILLDKLDIRELCTFCYTKNRIYFDFSDLHIEISVNNERIFNKCSPSTSLCFCFKSKISEVLCIDKSPKELEQQQRFSLRKRSWSNPVSDEKTFHVSLLLVLLDYFTPFVAHFLAYLHLIKHLSAGICGQDDKECVTAWFLSSSLVGCGRKMKNSLWNLCSQYVISYSSSWCGMELSCSK